tara:strand:- start:282 stop:599 length:318 start_codon:yes stop_codon:yes gene_type:complete
MTVATEIKEDIVLDQVIAKEPDAPGKWNVIFLNDNQTPMDFVVEVLQLIFKHAEPDAIKITQTVHEDGKAIAGTYNFEIAEQKTNETTQLARANKFPLTINIEPQ